MSGLAQYLTAGLALGAVYALVALGFVVIYRASEVFNFAQGEFVTFGAFAMVTIYQLLPEMTLPVIGSGARWTISLVGAMVLAGILGALVERAFLRKLIGRPVFVTIILTIFVGFILRTLLLIGFGSNPVRMPTPWEATGDVSLFGASVLYNSVGAIVAGLLALGAFFVILKYTRLGVAMRATASDQEVALGLGIPVGRIFGTTWFIAGALAALGGVFLGMFPRSTDVHMGFIALRAFPAVIVGGLDSATGAVVAGFLLGLLEVISQAYINPHLGGFGENFHEVLPYLVMIAVLIVKPYGLFGSKDVERV